MRGLDRRPAASHRRPGALSGSARETNRLVADFRDAALQRLGWGAALIVAVVWIGLRSWRRVAAALLPVLLALVLVVAALLALGERLSLFHLVSLLLVLGIGVDYGLFFSRPDTDPACAAAPCTRCWSAVVRR
jgi:predicted exporter